MANIFEHGFRLFCGKCSRGPFSCQVDKCWHMQRMNPLQVRECPTSTIRLCRLQLINAKTKCNQVSYLYCLISLHPLIYTDAQWRAPTDGAPTGRVANERQTPCWGQFPNAKDALQIKNNTISTPVTVLGIHSHSRQCTDSVNKCNVLKYNPKCT